MSLLRIIKDQDRSIQVGLWKIEESPEELHAMAKLTREEEKIFSTFKSDSRKKQWLSCRILLKKMIRGKFALLEYDLFGKPVLKKGSHHISISHSGEFAVIMTSETSPVGIDIEKITERIERIRSRFLSQEEERRIGEQNRLEKLYVLWGAKESLYKIYGRPEVDLQKDILISPFDYLYTGKGRCTGRMKTPEGEHEYSIHYENLGGYMLVTAVKNHLPEC